MQFYSSVALVLTLALHAQAAFVSFNEHIEQYALDKGIGVDVVLGVTQNVSEGHQP